MFVLRRAAFREVALAVRCVFVAAVVSEDDLGEVNFDSQINLPKFIIFHVPSFK